MARPFTARTIGRAGIVFLALALALGGPFLIWGEDFATGTDAGGPSAWLSSYGDYAWAAAIALLIADLALPVPTTAVMAALGIIYGPLLGRPVALAADCLRGRRLHGRPVAHAASRVPSRLAVRLRAARLCLCGYRKGWRGVAALDTGAQRRGTLRSLDDRATGFAAQSAVSMRVARRNPV